MGLLKRFVQNPAAYFNRMKFILAGLYFDYFIKEYKTNGCRFLIPKEFTDLVGRGHFTFDLYEMDERNMVNEALDKSGNVLELGGCLGVISCIVNKMLAEPENHVVVEANPALITYLTNNRDKNNCRFKIENVVISNESHLSFYVGNSIVESGLHKGGEDWKKIDVKGVHPEELEKKHKIKFETLVIDIEGAEYLLIKEFPDFIEGLRTIFMEEHPHIIGVDKYKEYEDILIAKNFTKVLFRNNISCWKKQTIQTA